MDFEDKLTLSLFLKRKFHVVDKMCLKRLQETKSGNTKDSVLPLLTESWYFGIFGILVLISLNVIQTCS